MKGILFIAIGFVGGWAVGQAFAPKAYAATPAQSRQIPAARMATNILDICDTIRPALVRFQEAYRDGHMSAAELYQIYQEINALT
jgi:hypothetical protein